MRSEKALTFLLLFFSESYINIKLFFIPVIQPFKGSFIFFNDFFNIFNSDTVEIGSAFGAFKVTAHSFGRSGAGVRAGKEIEAVNLVKGQVDFFIFGIFSGINGIVKEIAEKRNQIGFFNIRKI